MGVNQSFNFKFSFFVFRLFDTLIPIIRRWGGGSMMLSLSDDECHLVSFMYLIMLYVVDGTIAG